MSTQKLLTTTLPDVPALLAMYMSFLERGGLFVATRERCTLGDPVILMLTLPGDDQELTVNGSVAWISPDGVTGRRLPGVGVHFSHQDHNVRDRIETLLAGQLDGAAASCTL
ncbi:PilZ domain-containing protein [Halomonas piscis]|uniref:PilZ domain-containing protein n=1 Tax=Halomonas piscis TaxID=3031727 RepID=UPI0028A23049|nr:PilZ domain-containing protein [Halomonas piscis]